MGTSTWYTCQSKSYWETTYSKKIPREDMASEKGRGTRGHLLSMGYRDYEGCIAREK
jgi:hypothetical protein